MKDYYYILGTKSTASIAEIKSSYRKLSKKFHPDVNSGETFFEERFKEILEAYEILSDNNKRAEYDIKLEHFRNEEATTYEKELELLRKEEALKQREAEFNKREREFENAKREEESRGKNTTTHSLKNEDKQRTKRPFWRKIKNLSKKPDSVNSFVDENKKLILPMSNYLIRISRFIFHSIIIYIVSIIFSSLIIAFFAENIKLINSVFISLVFLASISLIGFFIVVICSIYSLLLYSYHKQKYFEYSYLLLVRNLDLTFKYVSPILLGPFGIFIFIDAYKNLK